MTTQVKALSSGCCGWLWLLPAVAQAQDAWSVVLVEGSAVMGESSTLTFEARNAATSTRPISQIVFAFPAGYTLQGGEGPARWVPGASTTRTAASPSTWTATPASALHRPGPGESARFKVKLVGALRPPRI
jgi:hypothetical protein